MSQRNRLSSGGRIDRSRPVRFTFNGQSYQGFAGDTLASALLANGVDVVNRSFKYSRPRGIVAAGADEPNAIFQLGEREAAQVPNVRATQQALYNGLVATSTNGWPNVDRDVMGVIGKMGGRFMPPGFYYKTFMSPASMWPKYEKYIRKAAGLGRAPRERDPDIYDHINRHCDVLVIGAGPAGLAAAYAAGRAGARVILCDEQEEMGGSLLDSRELIDGRPAAEWAAAVVAELATMPDVLLLPRTTANGYHDHNFVTLHERRTEHLADTAPLLNGRRRARARMHKVRAGQVILATGTHERPLVYANNDVPGNMVAGAVSIYIRRFAVAPGQRLVLSTSNDHAYRAALDWHDAGREVAAIVDARANPEGDLVHEARSRRIRIITGSAVIEARGEKRVSGALVASIDSVGFRVYGAVEELACDTIATSGGYSPVVHLAAHSGVRPEWRDDILGFVPGDVKGLVPVGGVNGRMPLAEALVDGLEAGSRALMACGFESPSMTVPAIRNIREGRAVALYQVPHVKPAMRAPKQFVDQQNDVTAAGIELATREGFESIEHVKRYTGLGFGTDQGKLGNINGMAIAARCLKQTIPQTGTTVFRPNYTPITFGAIAGRHCGEFFDPRRYTALHAWHVANGAKFEEVGQWMRPWYFPRGNETMHEAVQRECRAVREGVGILDASTLGKIEIQGKDAREFLNRLYTNAWTKLDPGKCRYGLMCKDDGMIMDDGVTACLGENHFHMTTTTGGAAGVLDWMELWHQTEWPELEVYFNSVTDHWAAMAINGPNARKLLAELTDIDLSKEKFGFMDWREGTVAGVPARVFRISFTGELSYEINVQANHAMHVWKALFEKGEKYGLTPYGTETMHVLRAEKGFIIIGQETDGSVTPEDLGMQWCVGYKKPYSWIGRRALSRPDTKREDRKQLVGLKPLDRNLVLQEGAQIVLDKVLRIPMPMVGHVTSSYFSPTLGHSFALALVKGGSQRIGQTVYMPMADGTIHAAEVVSPVFYDPKGERQHV
ncbi:sarcosine oxidase subunit alpha [Azoarcus sp. KH32C]|uniref:sarcosine oxidase subunit alpha n=1 Tax=Azoarcus sp. KH32C TaxID=748247 RepID=UPI0002385D89|nr:sarcosine oxidase subunit alpha [Azoarcus sp. KH32C]BAL27065.1 sarcosine oxidase alpha subunit family protein [Azoarcus sp. KH32C]